MCGVWRNIASLPLSAATIPGWPSLLRTCNAHNSTPHGDKCETHRTSSVHRVASSLLQKSVACLQERKRFGTEHHMAMTVWDHLPDPHRLLSLRYTAFPPYILPAHLCQEAGRTVFGLAFCRVVHATFLTLRKAAALHLGTCVRSPRATTTLAPRHGLVLDQGRESRTQPPRTSRSHPRWCPTCEHGDRERRQHPGSRGRCHPSLHPLAALSRS